MKILVIGAFGTIGQAVVNNLKVRHKIISAGRSKGDYVVDLSSEESVIQLYKSIGLIDAVVCAAGTGYFAPMDEVTPERFKAGLNEKLLGQINLVLLGQHILADHGSFTLISGILSNDPIHEGLNSSTINAAIEGFVKASAIELKRGIRINVINPSIVTESINKYGQFFRGFKSVSASEVALAYSKSVEGLQTGQVYKVR